jgi:hypothetical protein
MPCKNYDLSGKRSEPPIFSTSAGILHSVIRYGKAQYPQKEFLAQDEFETCRR